MKVYIAKDWTGSKVFAEPPVLMKCGGMPDVWSAHKLPFDITGSFAEDEIPRGQYLESLTQDDLFVIIKYGLRGDERAPLDVTVEDIYYVIQCNPL